jgi:hypothetical protein
MQGSGSPSVGVSKFSLITADPRSNYVPAMYYRYRVTVPAGQTIILMHFILQRDKGDGNGANSGEAAIINFSDTNALFGMTDDEKAKVVNFVIPQ